MKEIELTRGYVALVDDEDFEWLNRYNWYANVHKNGYVRPVRVKTKDSKIVFMSRMILNVTNSDVIVDHKDRNPLNNQKSNLRICNKSQNGRNVAKKTRGTSKYIGVAKVPSTGKWRASITFNYKNISLGTFIKEEDAAMAYNIKAVEISGGFANLNVIS